MWPPAEQHCRYTPPRRYRLTWPPRASTPQKPDARSSERNATNYSLLRPPVPSILHRELERNDSAHGKFSPSKAAGPGARPIEERDGAAEPTAAGGRTSQSLATGNGLLPSLPCALPGTGPNRRKLRGNGIIKRQMKQTAAVVVCWLKERTCKKKCINR